MLFEEQLKKHPEQLAITDTLSSRSWKQLNKNVLALRTYFLKEKELKTNDHIAFLIGNRIEFFEAMLAGITAGLWVTPINTHLSIEEQFYILEDCGAKLLLIDQELSSKQGENLPCEALQIEALVARLSNKPDTSEALDETAKAGGTMLYTSGTTGRPKGVRRNKPELLSDALNTMRQGALGFGLKGLGPHLITGPLYHAAPMLFALYDMLNGAPLIIMPKWSCENFVELVDKFQVRTSHLVPTMFIRLLQFNEKNPIPSERLNSLELVLHGAAPIAPAIKHKMIEWWGPILLEYWGASEAGTSTLINSEEWLTHPGSVGKALAHLEIFIGDELGNPINEETGLLFCRHKHLKQVFEYHKAPDKTKEAHPKPNTFCIGDIGRIDDEGFVYLSDRKSNMIISGGVNIYPAEIEQALIEHPAISDLVVFGIPDEEWGESVKALIELKEYSQANESLVENIKTFAKEKIASYKVPRTIEFIEELPRNAAGKVRLQDIKNLKATNT
jgi:acyl-CoA synthetase (AMP-forming)/AMP-acid ligase II